MYDKRTILVVEDTEDFFTLVKEALRAEFNLVHAWDGEQALSYLKSHDRPSAIVLDVSMPIMNGWQFLSEQRRDKNFSDVPVIVYSCEPNANAMARELRVAGFVAKSCGARALLTEVLRCCR
jgi:CheY-like chemotaxis protein